MKLWQSTGVIALVAALPIEPVNFFVAMPPLDIEMSPDAPWINQALALEWLVLHLPGILLMNALGPSNSTPLNFSVWILFGYLDTALLLFAVILGMRAVVRLVAKHSASPA
jgi:hypothetical protein